MNLWQELTDKVKLLKTFSIDVKINIPAVTPGMIWHWDQIKMFWVV